MCGACHQQRRVSIKQPAPLVSMTVNRASSWLLEQPVSRAKLRMPTSSSGGLHPSAAAEVQDRLALLGVQVYLACLQPVVAHGLLLHALPCPALPYCLHALPCPALLLTCPALPCCEAGRPFRPVAACCTCNFTWYACNVLADALLHALGDCCAAGRPSRPVAACCA